MLPLPLFLNLNSDSIEMNLINNDLSLRESNRFNLSFNQLINNNNNIASTSTSTSASTTTTTTSALYLSKFKITTGLNNKLENRYTDIIAYDSTRIKFPLNSNLNQQYINASLIQVPEIGLPLSLPRTNWIAAQAPLPHTIHTFLSLLLHPIHSDSISIQNSTQPLPVELPPPKLIIQLTKLKELNKSKCSSYFPLKVGEIETYTAPTAARKKKIWIKLLKKTEELGWRRNDLLIGFVEGDSEESEHQGREIVHVEYRAWPDHGVPSDPSHLLKFMKSMTKLSQSLSPPSPTSTPTSESIRPILIHCSAGVGRTGTYITISSLLPYLELLSTTLRSSSKKAVSAQSKDQVLLLPLPPPPPSPLPVYDPFIPSESNSNLNDEDRTRNLIGLIIDGLREQRGFMVQNSRQVEFIWEALRVFWEGLES